jgi:hypothetical protein
MQGGIFQVDDRELKTLVNLFKKMPREFQVVVSQILSQIAATVKFQSSKVIGRDMTVRNSRFVDSVLRYSRAKPQAINRQFSTAGSIAKDRFTGWIEQETGQQQQRTRVGTLLARQGDKQKQIPSKNRLKPGTELLEPENFGINNAKDDDHRIIIFLQMLERLQFSQLFIIRKPIKGFRRGIYRRKPQGGGFDLIQSFDQDKDQPKRNPWIQKATKEAITDQFIRELWIKELQEAQKRLGPI